MRNNMPCAGFHSQFYILAISQRDETIRDGDVEPELPDRLNSFNLIELLFLGWGKS
jgi:hypothetical protein